jgi:hypothetical protein
MNKIILALLSLTVAFSTGCTTVENKDAGRSMASTKHIHRLKLPPMPCEKAYLKAQDSMTPEAVTSASKTCTQIAEAICAIREERESGGTTPTGDGQFVAAHCELEAAYGANKATNQGSATADCEQAFKVRSMSLDQIRDAADTCHKATDVSCQKYADSDQSPNKSTASHDSLVASCNLDAIHGAVMELNGPNAICREVEACERDCPENSAHPGMCPATCQENFDPAHTCTK